MLHDVTQCHSGAGGGCGLGWDVAAVVEHDITRVRGVVGSNVTVACRMGWLHKEPAPTLPMMWAKGWGCVCGYMRSPGDSISPPAVPQTPHNPLPVPQLPSQSHPTLLVGYCQPQPCVGTDEPYRLHPCHGASTLSLCCLAAPCVCAPMAHPALFPSSRCLYPCLACWLRVTRFSHAEQAPWGDCSSWGDLATRCNNTSQDMALLGQERLSSALCYKQDPIASNLRWSFMLGPRFYQQHAGNHEALPIHHAEPGHPSLPPSQNGLALGCASPPHGTKHRICWEKPFVSNQEHCFLLERLHPAWRDFSCSWMGQRGTWGMGQAAGSRSWRGGRAGEPCQWPGDNHPLPGWG